MHNILDFPDEILHRIIHFLSPTDFESLILSNKTIYDLTGPARRRHFKLKKRDEVLELSVDYPASHKPRQPVDDDRHALFLLGTILETADVASYPTTLVIHGGYSWTPGRGDEQGDVLYKQKDVIAKHSFQLAKMVDERGFVFDPNLMEEMSNDLEELESEGSLYLFITLLPHLTCLNLYTPCHPTEAFSKIVQQIAVANRDPKSPLNDVALSQLQEILLYHPISEYSKDMRFYAPFILLPSIHRLRACHVHCRVFS